VNHRQLQYALLLSATGSFSQAAEKLGISQPAFSKQILSLEKELGIPLFRRDSTAVTLTPAGEVFIREARELVLCSDRLQRQMERFRAGEEGRLTIGISQFRGLSMMPRVIEALHAVYPQVQVDLRETTTDVLRQEAAEGKYDFAVVNLPVNECELEAIPMEPDTLVLAVPESLLPLSGHTAEDPIARLGKCASLPFVAPHQGQALRQVTDGLFARAGILPKITLEATYLTSVWELVKAGLGAAVLPLQLAEGKDSHKICLFPLPDSGYSRQSAVIYRRGQYLPAYAKYAIRLITGKEIEENGSL